ncbi:hypothetical protein HK405_000081, partial [Cladochytrium tenue]
ARSRVAAELARLRAMAETAPHAVRRVVVHIAGAAASYGFAATRAFWADAYARARRVAAKKAPVPTGSATSAAQQLLTVPCPTVLDPPGFLHVALHIRRGDVLRYATKGHKSHSPRLAALRFTPDAHFVAVLRALLAPVSLPQPANSTTVQIQPQQPSKQIKPLLDPARVVIHIVSDADSAGIAAVQSAAVALLAGAPPAPGNSSHHPRVRLYASNSPAAALHLLAAADILVGSKSGFTQLAAVVGPAAAATLKLLPAAKWPRYDGVSNVVAVPELAPSVATSGATAAAANTTTEWDRSVRSAAAKGLRAMAAAFAAARAAPGTWICEHRNASVVADAVYTALGTSAVAASR